MNMVDDECIAMQENVLTISTAISATTTPAATTVEETNGSRGDGDRSGDTHDALIVTREDEKAIQSNENAGGEGGGATGASFNFHKFTAFMPTDRHAVEYNMNHKNRGRALIFNHECFDIPNLMPRKATDVDTEDLTKALERLDFTVTAYKDCKLKDILKHIGEAASEDHSDNDCIFIAILSHGDLGYIFAKDVQYKLDSISHFFTAQNCPTLAGKPKLFFIQACQGDRFDPGVLLTHKTQTDGETTSVNYKIPLHADFLIAYSTIPGFYSWRNPTNGSWFIQSLVHELNANAKKHDFLTLLTFVIQRVAMNYESNCPDRPLMDQQKQIPCVTTMLTRILRFRDKVAKLD